MITLSKYFGHKKIGVDFVPGRSLFAKFLILIVLCYGGLKKCIVN